MIEIKFRAWNKDHKSMEYISDLYWFEENGVHNNDGDGHCADYVIMQYANLHDMTGKELYDGDISMDERNRKWITWLGKGGFKICTVKEFFLSSENPIIIESLGDLQNSNWFEDTNKIIGNIYENPEVLDYEKEWVTYV